MTSGYYIRIRGKSQGPYSTEQLRGFVQRGQLSRLHELSADGTTWARASAHPELFDKGQEPTIDSLGLAPNPPASSSADPTYGMANSPGTAAKDNRQSPHTEPDAWYHTRNGTECGPISFAALQALIAGGKLGPSDVVWRDGMADWAPPRTIPGLVPNAGNPGTVLDDFKDLSKDIRRGLLPDVEGGSPGEISTEACRAIAGMRPWMLFVAIFWYVGAVLNVGLGILEISFANGIVGLGTLIGGMLTACGATLLVICFNRLGDVLHTRRQHELERGLHAVRRFWVFVGILLIVMLSLLAISILVLLAIGSSLVHLPDF